MLTYTFSRREKILLLVLAIILVLLAWYMLVFQRTNDQITKIDSEISSVQTEATIASTRVSKMNYMESVIQKSKESGAQARPVPDFNNMTPLMAELNNTLAAAVNYTLSFDELDEETSGDYVLRGVRADYSCNSLAQAEAIAIALESGRYPGVVDSIVINDQTAGANSRVAGRAGGAPVSASVHVTFIERK